MAKRDHNIHSEVRAALPSNTLNVSWRGIRPEISASGWGIAGAVVIVFMIVVIIVGLPAVGFSHLSVR